MPILSTTRRASQIGDPGQLRIVGRFGRYVVRSVLQHGGMGEVFLAEVADGPSRGLRVVVKRPMGIEQDEELAAMFKTEVEVMSRLDHRNIVRMIDNPKVDGASCIGLEFIRGRNLRQVLQACKRAKRSMPPPVACYIARELLQGLAYAHSFRLDDGRPLNLIHRDVTPGNVLVGFEGSVKLTDFGVSKSAMSSVSTQIGVVKGTTRYLSPEQARGEPLTPRSDLFSVAVVLIEMLTLKPLFGASGSAALLAIGQGRHKALKPLLPVPSQHLPELLEKALSIDLEDRPRDAKHFIELLGAAEDATFGRQAKVQDLVLFLRALFPAHAENSPADRATETLSYLLSMYEDEVLLAPQHDEVEIPSRARSRVDRRSEALKSFAEAPGSLPLDARDFEGTDPEGLVEPYEASLTPVPKEVIPMTPRPAEPEAEVSEITEVSGRAKPSLLRDLLVFSFGVAIGVMLALILGPFFSS